MDGGHVAQTIADAHGDRIAFAPAQGGRGQAVVDGDRRARAASEVDPGSADGKIELVPGQCGYCGGCCVLRVCRCAPESGTCGNAAQGQALDEITP